jgi:hypothetical protein
MTVVVVPLATQISVHAHAGLQTANGEQVPVARSQASVGPQGGSQIFCSTQVPVR